MKATDFLRRRQIGLVAGNSNPTLSRRDWRGFLLLLIAGGRVVVMNADFRGGSLQLSANKDGHIANNLFRQNA